MEVEAAARTGKSRHAVLDFLRCHTVQPGKGDSGDSVLDIYFHGHAQLDIGNTDIGTDKIEEYLAVSDTDVLGIKVGDSRQLTIVCTFSGIGV